MRRSEEQIGEGAREVLSEGWMRRMSPLMEEVMARNKMSYSICVSRRDGLLATAERRGVRCTVGVESVVKVGRRRTKMICPGHQRRPVALLQVSDSDEESGDWNPPWESDPPSDCDSTLSVDKTVMFVDFDWSGEQEKVRYPAGVNHKSTKRPAGARDGNRIQVVHDKFMLELLRGSLLEEEGGIEGSATSMMSTLELTEE